jgi:tetratricopeptide (TPR) repeat protein
MKRFWLLTIISLFLNITHAQTVPDAEKLMYYERYESAASVLQKILSKNAQNPEAWWLLTRCYLHNDKLASYRDSLSLLPASLEGSPFIECARGDYMLRRGKKDSAAFYLNSALIKTSQKDPVILAAVALAHMDADSGDISLATDLLKKAIRRDKSNSMYWVYLGRAYRKQANGTEAYKAFNKAVEMDPGNAEALYRLGKIFEMQHNPDLYIKYYIQATHADSAYAPAWYALYYHDCFRNPNEALGYLQHFMFTSDHDTENDYRETDLLFLSGQFATAIKKAESLINSRQPSDDGRLYKLVAYSYHAMNDSVNALKYMDLYFKTESEKRLIQKDFETMGEMLARFSDKADSAAAFYGRAADLEKDSNKRIGYYKTIASLYKKAGDHKNQAVWLGRYYNTTPQPTNLDLFNWGIAEYLAANYKNADTVFGRYIEKYPEQTFGYYWRARANAAIDTAMQYGLPAPYYEKLIELENKNGPENQNKKWLIEAHGYLAAYEANTLKDYPNAMDNLEKVLALDPENESAKKYISILKKSYQVQTTSKNK